jgi:hypothetical protein
MGKVEAFERLGVALRNYRWSWSGVSSGTSTTPQNTKVFTAWGDPKEFYKDKSTGKYVYRGRWNPNWQTKAGGSEMKPLLQAALSSGEPVRLVYIEAVDWNEEPLRVQFANPLDKLWFRVTRFESVSGEFDFEEC